MVIFKFDSRFLLTQVRWIRNIMNTYWELPRTPFKMSFLVQMVGYVCWFISKSFWIYDHTTRSCTQISLHTYDIYIYIYYYLCIYIWVVFSNIQKHKTIYSVYVHISTLFTLCSILVLYAQFQYRKQTNKQIKQTNKLTNQLTNKQTNQTN